MGAIAIAAGSPGLKMAVDVAGFVIGMASLAAMIFVGLTWLMKQLGEMIVPLLISAAMGA